MTSKICRGCGVDKPLTSYNRHKDCKHGVHSRCKACDKAYQRSRYQKLTADGKRHPYRNDIKRRHILKKQFGMSELDFLQLKERQGGVCAICKLPETGTSGVKRTPRELAVDHCHTTGKVRGLLCSKHNQALGLFDDNPDLLEAAKEYLKGDSNGSRY